MVRFSNNLVGLLNFITFLLSIPILGAGIWLSRQSSTECEKFLQGPAIALGLFLMVVSLAGLVGACCRVSWLLWFYLLVMFLLIVLLFCFTIFAFAVTNKGAGEVVSGKGYKQYRLGDYSNWLQKRVSSTKNWNKIRSCLIDGKVCKSLVDDGVSNNITAEQFSQEKLSPIQSGCCIPPDDCSFTYISPTNWTTQSNSSFTDTDCSQWNNNASVLCFNCGSCKGGVLDNIKHDWKKVAIVNIIFLVFLVIVYSIGCCAFRNNREDNSWNKYPRRYP
ncbi:hypothetical protein RHGRI_000118 [Rhododendron griersonianum]|uniref:Tetraspanin-8 n=1 Tax=Rhododendron griersonianum TaxID=479676 RepID=A0AAV6LFR8_9ERIC|nr:hypothetical protein RHGRI_000118 [Rhododendron griersonianum]